MLMTEEQRRWWFATHPEYSWSRTRSRLLGRRFGDSDFAKTTLANERLREFVGHPAADPNAYDKYEDVLDRIWDYGKEQEHGFREHWDLFRWRARQDGLTEEQARDLWNKQEWTNTAYAPAHNPSAALAAGVGGIRNALAKRAAASAEREGESRLGSLWKNLQGPRTAKLPLRQRVAALVNG